MPEMPAPGPMTGPIAAPMPCPMPGMMPEMPGMMPQMPGMMPGMPGMVSPIGAYPMPTVPYPPSGGMIPGGPVMEEGPQVPGMLPLEQSYIENILRLNRGKVATIYMTFENNVQWNAKCFRGCIEAAGRDHIILSDPKTGKRYLLLMVNVDYVTFDEPIAYDYPGYLASPVRQR
ncbi:spore coat protein GerQ [Heliobacterium undosum]|uniref:Spore coat protein GerQ n=2 Tax=Heliomicrobium undosum TaxID=121734 RepID=A0A845L8S8_9FIRM|nr:spore coat protein GerQ [Heliomicrobium undosum]